MDQCIWTGAHYTHPGKVRTINEDSLLNLSGESLWVVADGMGGHSAGDYASQLLVRELAKYRHNPARGVALAHIEAILEACNNALVKKAMAEDSGIIGSTVAVLSLHNTHAVTTWCGDSRIYRLRGKQLIQLTRDHTYQSLTEDRDQNCFPEAYPGDGQLLTSAIGGGEDTRIEHCWYELRPGDRFLLCTDGLYKEVPETEIASAMQDGQAAAQILSGLAKTYLDRGARDNIGMIYVVSGQDNQ